MATRPTTVAGVAALLANVAEAETFSTIEDRAWCCGASDLAALGQRAGGGGDG